jgi:hypothetical protein
VTIADHQAVTLRVQEVGVASDVLLDLILQHLGQEPLSSLMEDLGESIFGGWSLLRIVLERSLGHVAYPSLLLRGLVMIFKPAPRVRRAFPSVTIHSF